MVARKNEGEGDETQPPSNAREISRGYLMNYYGCLRSPWCPLLSLHYVQMAGGETRGVTGHDHDPKVQCPWRRQKEFIAIFSFFLYFNFFRTKHLFFLPTYVTIWRQQGDNQLVETLERLAREHMQMARVFAVANKFQSLTMCVEANISQISGVP